MASFQKNSSYDFALTETVAFTNPEIAEFLFGNDSFDRHDDDVFYDEQTTSVEMTVGLANATVTGTSSVIHSRRWIFLSLLVLPVWILFGNLLVLISVIGFRHLRTLSNWVIASLALTDLLLAVTVVPLGIYQLVNRSWDLGLEACLFWTGSDVLLSTTSIMHLCAIAIHRHLGIAYPLRMRRCALSRRHAICLLLPVWTVSAAVSASLVVQGALERHPVLVIVTDDDDGDDREHTLTERKLACGIYDRTFAVYSSMVSFFVPLAVMVAVDFRSVQILRAGRRRDDLLGRISEYTTIATIASPDTATPSSTSISMSNTISTVLPPPSTSGSIGSGRDSSVLVTSPSRTYFLSSIGNSPTSECDVRAAFKSNVGVSSCGGSGGCLTSCPLISISVSGRLNDVANAVNVSDPLDCCRSRRSTAASRLSSVSVVPQSEIVPTLLSRSGGGSGNIVGPRSARSAGGYGRFLTSAATLRGGASRESIGVAAIGSVSTGSKLNSRERRAGKTLIWVFVIFVVLWLPFFCTNLAYGLCGPDHVPVYYDGNSYSASSGWIPEVTPVPARTVDNGVVNSTVEWRLHRSSTENGSCFIPEAIFTSFTWLGYLSSGVNPLLYTALNTDFQNAFRAILTCGYRGLAARRISRSNLFS